MVFTESTPTALALAHVQKMVVPMSERTELPIPEGLESIILQLLEKKPDNRLRSAQELQRRLRALSLEPYTQDDAANWWHTNLPETAARIQPVLEDTTPTHDAFVARPGVEGLSRA
jgi:serine/threonine-protein kinase